MSRTSFLNLNFKLLNFLKTKTIGAVTSNLLLLKKNYIDNQIY